MNGINKKNVEPSGLVPLSEVIAAADNVLLYIDNAYKAVADQGFVCYRMNQYTSRYHTCFAEMLPFCNTREKLQKEIIDAPSLFPKRIRERGAGKFREDCEMTPMRNAVNKYLLMLQEEYPLTMDIDWCMQTSLKPNGQFGLLPKITGQKAILTFRSRQARQDFLATLDEPNCVKMQVWDHNAGWHNE